MTMFKLKNRPNRSPSRSRRAASLSGPERMEERMLLSAFTVTTTNDSGPGSLQQAILDANANAGADLIDFNIPGAGVQTIRPRPGTIPYITDPVVIDGYTQPGSRPNSLANGSDAILLIELDGSLAGPLASGLDLVTHDS